MSKRLSSYEVFLKACTFDWKARMEFFKNAKGTDCRWVCVHDLEGWAQKRREECAKLSKEADNEVESQFWLGHQRAFEEMETKRGRK